MELLFAPTVSNSALITPDGKYGMLATWVESVQHAGVKNFMVIALDEQTGARAVPRSARRCSTDS
jgi:hypothetical protein